MVENNIPDKDLQAKNSPSNEDDDITIDFSKIKNIFKRKAKEPISEKDTETRETKPSDKDDEELSIDFSKIKKLFKEKTPPEPEEHVDFSELKRTLNIKELLRFEEKPSEETKAKPIASEEGEIHFDIKKIFGQLYKKSNILIPAFLIFIVILISLYIRLQNANLPITDIWASNSVSAFYLNQIRSAIGQRYPNLPDANKEDLVNKEYQGLLQEKKNEIEEQKRQTSLFFKSKFQDDNGNLYMPDIDPYYWYRYAKNIIEHGHIGDEIRNNMPFDNHMLAPFGYPILNTDIFHPYFLSLLYKILRLFNSELSIMNAIMYSPLIISVLSIIPIFLIARKIAGNLGGVASALITSINTIFVSRTLFGHADSDAWVVFFPVYATWLFIEAIDSKALIKTILLSSIAGLLIGIFSYVWNGWWYIFDFILLSSIIIIFLSIINYGKAQSLKGYVKDMAGKNIIISLIFLSIFTGIIVTKNEGYASFFQAPLRPLGFTQFKEAIDVSLWPNVLTTVAELKEGTLPEIINSVGGKHYFIIALLGSILILQLKEKKQLYLIIFSIIWFTILATDYLLNINLALYLLLLGIPFIIGVISLLFNKEHEIADIKLALLLIIWLISGIYASTKGIRFTLVITPAFGIAFGIAIAKFVEYFSRMLNKEFHISKIISTAIMLIIVVLLYIAPIQASYHTAVNDIPIINDAWYNALTLIKNNSTKDAIITSWWDFGHHFKALADRSVTFDGSTQATPQAHWVGNILLNSDEKIAVGILHMLNCGGNTAFDELNKIINDTTKSVDILYKIIEKDEGAKELLHSLGLKESEINNILKYAYCVPVESFFITSEDMIGKAPVWGHFGAWDFNMALAYNTLKKPEYEDAEKAIKFLEERLNYTTEAAENLYFEITNLKSEDVNNWISPWPIYSGIIPCRNLNNQTLNCGNIEINLTSYNAVIRLGASVQYPKVAVFPVKDGYIKRGYNGSIAILQNGRPLGITLIPGENYAILPADYLLSDSIFTKLFYLDGHGLKKFRKFYEEQTILGNKIIVWKVDWEGNMTNNIITK